MALLFAFWTLPDLKPKLFPDTSSVSRIHLISSLLFLSFSHKVKKFADTKYTSFQRQLNLYGFRRISKGEDQGSYFHPKFQRHRKDMLFEIRRLPAKQHGSNLQPTEQLVDAFRRPTASGVDSELEVKVRPSMPLEGDSSLPPGEHGHPIGG